MQRPYAWPDRHAGVCAVVIIKLISEDKTVMVSFWQIES